MPTVQQSGTHFLVIFKMFFALFIVGGFPFIFSLQSSVYILDKTKV